MNATTMISLVAAVALGLGVSSCLVAPPQYQGAGPSGAHASHNRPANQRSLGDEPGETDGPAGARGPHDPTHGHSGSERHESARSAPTTIDVKNECSKTVQLFIGDKPKFGSGTKTSLSSNSSTSYPRKSDGTAMIWIVDEHENGLSSVRVSPDDRRVEIGSSCTDLRAH